MKMQLIKTINYNTKDLINIHPEYCEELSTLDRGNWATIDDELDFIIKEELKAKPIPNHINANICSDTLKTTPESRYLI